MQIYATSNHHTKILDADIHRLSGQDHRGQTIETRQIVYVTDFTNKIFLSSEICM